MFACLPERIDMAAKIAASLDLLLGQIGLFSGEEARSRFACNGMREAVVRTVTSLGALRTSATRFAALDRSFGQRAATHGLGIGQLGRELAYLGRDIGRSRSGHAQSYGISGRKNRFGNWPFQKVAFW